MMDQKEFDALLDRWIEEHKNEMIEELGLWVSQKSVSRVDLGKPGAPYGPDCRKMLDLALERCRFSEVVVIDTCGVSTVYANDGGVVAAY